jgi:hypothetical protein
MKRPTFQQAHRRHLAALVAGVLALAGAPAAEAARAHSLHGVSVHLRSAARSLGRLTDRPAGPLAGMYLARVETQTALATGVARAIAAAAHGGASSGRAATALGLVADAQTSEAQTLTSVLGQVRPELQAEVARAISTATAGRGVVLGKLSGLLPDVSAQTRPVVAQVVALESSQGAQVPVELAGALGGSSVACAATGAVQQALVVATRSFQLGLAGLAPALALVPAAVRDQVQAEIDGVPSLLTHIEEQLAGAPTCSGPAPAPGPGAATPGGPAPVQALGTPALLGGMTQLIDGILGWLVPGAASPALAPAPAPLAGLLGGFGGLRALAGS